MRLRRFLPAAVAVVGLVFVGNVARFQAENVDRYTAVSPFGGASGSVVFGAGVYWFALAFVAAGVGGSRSAASATIVRNESAA